jgi:hypothetical protein
LECDPTSVDLLQPACPPNFHFDQFDPTKGESLMKSAMVSFADLPRVGFAVALNALRFTRLATLAWACALVAGLAPSAFAEIVYTMTNAPDLQNGWALSGTITVSGTGTGLGSAAITGWAYTVADGSNSYTYSSNGSNNFVNASGLLATPTQLIVPYSSAQARSTNSLDINVSGGSGRLSWDTGGSRDNMPSAYNANDFTGGGPSVSFWQVQEGSPAFFPSTTTDGWVIGSVQAVPEPSTCAMALVGLACGGYTLFRRRRAC